MARRQRCRVRDRRHDRRKKTRNFARRAKVLGVEVHELKKLEFAARVARARELEAHRKSFADPYRAARQFERAMSPSFSFYRR